MCQQGIETNEMVEYKRKVNTLNKDIKAFLEMNPFAFDLGKLSTSQTTESNTDISNNKEAPSKTIKIPNFDKTPMHKPSRHNRVKSGLEEDIRSMTTQSVYKVRNKNCRATVCDTINKSRVSTKNFTFSKAITRNPNTRKLKSMVTIGKLKVIKESMIELKNQLKLLTKNVKGQRLCCTFIFHFR